ncbi:MAG: SLATT domain-containing protein [Verrucomicrobiota bacterium]
MDVHAQTEDSAGSRRVLEAQLRECFGRVAYSHKTHEKCADIYFKKQSRFRVAQIILSALTTAGFVGVLFGSTRIAAVLGAFVSTGLLVLNSYLKQYNLGELVQKHKRAASDLWLIREKYLSLLTDLAMGEKPIENLQQLRDKLMDELHVVYQSAPPTLDQAYARAQKALQRDEELTFSDEEIDALLPKELRRGKPEKS